jgi:hypothetical protein
VQVDPCFAKRLAVVGDIDQGGIVRILGLQALYGLGQEVLRARDSTSLSREGCMCRRGLLPRFITVPLRGTVCPA